MQRSELIEWIAMLVVIVLWWPVLFLNWAPAYYYYPLAVVSGIVLFVIFRNRFRRMEKGFTVSERMMEQKRQMEQQVRGAKPHLDEQQPPDVSGELSWLAEGTSPEAPEDSEGQDEEPTADASDKLPFGGPPAAQQQPDTDREHTEMSEEDKGTDRESD